MAISLPTRRGILLLLVVLVPIFSLFLNSILSKPSPSSPSSQESTLSKPLISYERGRDADFQPGNNKWYSEDGTPLSYQAWRVKDTGGLSPEPTERSTITRYGARVACWPSNELGIWIKHATPLELDYLGLQRFRDTQRPWPANTTEEDHFCAALRRTGAEFWQLPPSKSQDLSCWPLEDCVEPQIRGHLGLGWPPGGGSCLVNLTDAKKTWGSGLSGYYNAKDMDERCDRCSVLGGVWCPRDPEVCEALWCIQYPEHCDEAKLLF